MRVQTIVNNLLSNFRFLLISLKHIRHLRRSNIHLYFAFARMCAPLWGNQNLNTWFQFALSTNSRGDKIADIIEREIGSLKGKTHLDVGSGYGGFSAAFVKRKAFSSGVEISEGLIQMSEYNFKDQKVHAPIYLLDITQKDIVSRLGQKFDIITCNDVIEHVKDPETAIKNMAELLNKDGVLYLEIPNKNYPLFVLEDGHYNLFALSLLNRNSAEKYFKRFYQDLDYGVEYYLEIGAYEALAAKYRLCFRLLEESFQYFDEERLKKARHRIAEKLNSFALSEDPVLGNEVVSVVKKYLSDYDTASGTEEFKTVYGTDFWKIICTKQ
jgi:2-polyprenyl-3-methyl-5-hydroxy-6-metoxy-1,4-benzoquinol methylase